MSGAGREQQSSVEEKPNSEVGEASQSVKESYLRLKTAVVDIERKNPSIFYHGTTPDTERKERRESGEHFPFPLDQEEGSIDFNSGSDDITFRWQEGNPPKETAVKTGISNFPGKTREAYYSIAIGTIRDSRDSTGWEFEKGKRRKTGWRDGNVNYLSEPEEITVDQWNSSEEKALIDKLTSSLEQYAQSLPEPRKGLLGRIFRRG